MKLSPLKEKALQSVLSCRTLKEAAEMAGISPRTLRGYFSDGEFLQRYRTETTLLVDFATTALQSGMAEAVKVMVEVMTSAETPARTKVAAADAVLTHALKCAEMRDIMARIAEIEMKVLG